MEVKKQCGDTRFRIIAKAKEHLFQATNIAEYKKELEVLDSFLLRCWQMGWLKQYEDAEEKKLNLKPFDIQKAREGKPVCTRNGRNVRIIAFDAKCADTPIIALVARNDGEILFKYYRDGKLSDDKDSVTDLMMLPEKKEGYVNIYRSQIYDTLERAKEAYKRTCNDDNYLKTIKIEWEE